MLHAFKLTNEAEQEGFSGGTMSVGNGIMFDVGKALSEGDGIIYTEDDIFAQVLRSYPALAETEAPEELPEGAQALPHPALELAGVPVHTEQVAPWTPQTNDQSLPQQRVEVLPGEGEIPAEHADPGDTIEAEVKAGEAVSGSGSSGSGTSWGGSSSSTSSELDELSDDDHNE